MELVSIRRPPFIVRNTWTWGDVDAPRDVSCENIRMMLLIARLVWGVDAGFVIAELPAPFNQRALLEDARNFVPLWVYVHMAHGIHDLVGYAEGASHSFAPERFAAFGVEGIRFQTWGDRRKALSQLLAPFANPLLGYRRVPVENLDFNWTKSYRVVSESPTSWMPLFFAREDIPLVDDLPSDWWIVEGLWPGITTAFGLPPARVVRRTRSYDPVQFFTLGLKVRDLQWRVVEEEGGAFILNGERVGERVHLLPRAIRDGTWWFTGDTLATRNAPSRVDAPMFVASQECLIGDYLVCESGDTMYASELSRRVLQAEIHARRPIWYRMRGDAVQVAVEPGRWEKIGAVNLCDVPLSSLPTAIHFTTDVLLPHGKPVVAKGEVWSPDLPFSARVSWDKPPPFWRRDLGMVWQRLFPNRRALERQADHARIAGLQRQLSTTESERRRVEDALQYKLVEMDTRDHDLVEVTVRSFRRFAARFPSEGAAQAVLDGEFHGHAVEQCVMLVMDAAGSTKALHDRIRREGAENDLERQARIIADAYSGFMTWAAEVARRHGGWVFGFEGDAIKVVFGLDAHQSRRRVTELAWLAARELMAGVGQWPRGDGLKFGARIGMATGTVYLSLVGSGDDAFMTTYARALNVAAHLEKEKCRREGGEVAMDGATAALLDDELDARRMDIGRTREILDGEDMEIVRVRLG